MIIDSEININNCREIKEYIRKQFNVILNKTDGMTAWIPLPY